MLVAPRSTNYLLDVIGQLNGYKFKPINSLQLIFQDELIKYGVNNLQKKPESKGGEDWVYSTLQKRKKDHKAI